MRRRQRAAPEEASIDITPMLDIVFIMLIFFIVTTSFVKESGIDIQRPSAQTAEKKNKAFIIVGISSTGDIFIDKRKVDLRAVRSNVERLRAESPEGGVVVQADEAAMTGVLVKVMDQIRLAGVKRISVAASESQ